MMLHENADEQSLGEIIDPAAGVGMGKVLSDIAEGDACACFGNCKCVLGYDGRDVTDVCCLCGARDDLWGERGFKACGDPGYCQARLLAARWRVYSEKSPYKQASPMLAARIALGEERGV